MKLHSELTAGTILRWQTRTHHHGVIHLVLAYLSTSSALNNPATSVLTNAVGRAPELLVTEQTHPPTLDLAGFPGPRLRGVVCGTWQLFGG